MTIVEQTDSKLTIRHTMSASKSILLIILLFPVPLMLLAFGILIELMLSDRLTSSLPTGTIIVRALALGLSFLLYLAILWFFFWAKPSNSMTIDRNAKEITFASFNSLHQKSTETFSFKDLSAFLISESEIDGAYYYYLKLTSNSGTCIQKTQLGFGAGFGLGESRKLVDLMNEYIKR